MEGLTSLGDGVWIATDPVQFLGLRLTATMAVLRLGDDGLLVWSPVAMTRERRTALEGLGAVAHLYAPNVLHHLWMAEWVEAFPSARVHAPAGLAKKRPDLRIDRTHGTTLEPALAGVDEHRIDGFRLEETVLFHRPSRTLLTADLVHNIGRPRHPWTSAYTRMMGFYDRVAVSRALRWTAFSDRDAARRSIDALLALPFERLVMGHGTPVSNGARDAVAAAYAWLHGSSGA